MTPAEEDALIKDCCPFEGFMPQWSDIRLAIRAAVAQERERAAKVCERYAGEHFEERAEECAAAIRRGE